MPFLHHAEVLQVLLAVCVAPLRLGAAPRQLALQLGVAPRRLALQLGVAPRRLALQLGVAPPRLRPRVSQLRLRPRPFLRLLGAGFSFEQALERALVPIVLTM